MGRHRAHKHVPQRRHARRRRRTAQGPLLARRAPGSPPVPRSQIAHAPHCLSPPAGRRRQAASLQARRRRGAMIALHRHVCRAAPTASGSTGAPCSARPCSSTAAKRGGHGRAGASWLGTCSNWQPLTGASSHHPIAPATNAASGPCGRSHAAPWRCVPLRGSGGHERAARQGCKTPRTLRK